MRLRSSPGLRRLGRAPAVATVALALLAGACSSEEDTLGSPASTTDSPEVASTETTEPPETTEATAGDQETASPTPAPTLSPPTTAPICSELLDGAQRLHPGDTDSPTADVDGDGADDAFWMADDSQVQVVRSSDGAVSEPVGLFGVAYSDPVLAAGDIDGDGLDEVFWSLGGNTSLTGVILELEDCSLRAVTSDELEFDYGDGMLTYTYFAGGNACAPTGCYFSVSCVATEEATTIVFTSIYPRVSVLDPEFDEASLDQPIGDQEVVFGQVRVRVTDGVGVVVDRTEDRPVKVGDIPQWTSRPDVACDGLEKEPAA